MRRKTIGLAAALAVAALAPAVVMSQSRDAGVTEKARTQGMAEAPALAQAAGLNCQIADARFIGKNEDRRARTSTSYYELDCQEGMGFVMEAVQGGETSFYTCLEAGAPTPDGKPSTLACQLPGNQNPQADLAALAAKGGVACPVANSRAIGRGATSTFFEVACQDGVTGYVLNTGYPATADTKVEATNCLIYDQADANIKCELTDAATRLGVVDQMAAADQKSCAVKDRRFVGATTDGSNYFEASCQDGKGYIYKVAAAGQLAESWDCARAQGILGGCTLTDAREAATEQAALYTELAKKAGFNCDVERYAAFPSPRGKDAVELVCANGRPGGVGVFNLDGSGEVFSCAYAPIAGYRCGLNEEADTYPVLTADLKKMGRDSCEVSAQRMVGKTADGSAYVEVACSDGLAGYMLQYKQNPIAPVEALGCAFAKGIAGGCKLPGNT
ncbi:hypothetical protein [Phenylobacterium sp.]|uniref:hypothetical protein n=1 Tax=Phenylobacterium sp. TaxID=1871053 RepID=UPI002FDAF5B1